MRSFLFLFFMAYKKKICIIFGSNIKIRLIKVYKSLQLVSLFTLKDLLNSTFLCEFTLKKKKLVIHELVALELVVV